MKNTNMASPLFGLFCASFIILVAVNAPVGDAEEIKVGDDEGWRVPGANNSAMYSQWAARNRFVVGDSLSFEYQNDSVLVVDKWGYYHCNTSKPISAYNNGNSVIKLDRPGLFYFISGTPDHCKDGQRLILEVMTLRPISQSPPSIASPPDPYVAVPPSPSPLSSSGVVTSMTLISVLMALLATLVTLVWCAP
ncbi:hypothetical protein L1049_004352 [Liquidambar formosana]|uniref:Phytocyanin domain-containing protein n=1 Tax=Liquidambar formosana TaxID=63359 RepID=A0AAP0RT82_LIQFO